MAGHNKWSKIKNKKAVEDAKKSRLFSIHAKIIAMEAGRSGGSREAPGLRRSIERAKAINMPSGNIERAIKHGTSGRQGRLEEVRYEAYGPGGATLIIEGITDNKNRSTQEVKHELTKEDYTLAAEGGATWAFTKNSDGWIPNNLVALNPDQLEQYKKLIAALEKLSDVKEVFANISH